MDVIVFCHIVYGCEFWLINGFPTCLFYLTSYFTLSYVLCVGMSCGYMLFSWRLGCFLKSCRQVDFLCLPIWMGSYSLEIFPIVVNRVCKNRLKTFFTTEEYFLGIATHAKNRTELVEQVNIYSQMD